MEKLEKLITKYEKLDKQQASIEAHEILDELRELYNLLK